MHKNQGYRDSFSFKVGLNNPELEYSKAGKRLKQNLTVCKIRLICLLI